MMGRQNCHLAVTGGRRQQLNRVIAPGNGNTSWAKNHLEVTGGRQQQLNRVIAPGNGNNTWAN